MIVRATRDDLDGYGIRSWVAVMVLGGALVRVMFAFATPIS